MERIVHFILETMKGTGNTRKSGDSFARERVSSLTFPPFFPGSLFLFPFDTIVLVPMLSLLLCVSDSLTDPEEG